MKKVGVSACLLGRNCRYDATNRYDSELVEELKDEEVVPFCPEEAILGTPRETIDIVEGRAIGNESGRDFTDALIKKAQEFLAKHPDIDAVYCKAKSPSCALCSARVYDSRKRLISSDGRGIFIDTIVKSRPDITIIERK